MADTPRPDATATWIALGITAALGFAELPVGGVLAGTESWARPEILRAPLLLLSAQALAAIVAVGLALRARRWGLTAVAAVAALWGLIGAAALGFALWASGLGTLPMTL